MKRFNLFENWDGSFTVAEAGSEGLTGVAVLAGLSLLLKSLFSIDFVLYAAAIGVGFFVCLLIDKIWHYIWLLYPIDMLNYNIGHIITRNRLEHKFIISILMIGLSYAISKYLSNQKNNPKYNDKHKACAKFSSIVILVIGIIPGLILLFC